MSPISRHELAHADHEFLVFLLKPQVVHGVFSVLSNHKFDNVVIHVICLNTRLPQVVYEDIGKNCIFNQSNGLRNSSCWEDW